MPPVFFVIPENEERETKKSRHLLFPSVLFQIVHNQLRHPVGRGLDRLRMPSSTVHFNQLPGSEDVIRTMPLPVPYSFLDNGIWDNRSNKDKQKKMWPRNPPMTNQRRARLGCCFETAIGSLLTLRDPEPSPPKHLFLPPLSLHPRQPRKYPHQLLSGIRLPRGIPIGPPRKGFFYALQKQLG